MLVERERVVSDYWYLCQRGAHRFVRRGLDRADLRQVGAIGLIKAADRYDRAQSAPFEAYAWLLIVGELMHHVRDSERFVRAPRSVRDLERRWGMGERELWALLGREPKESEIARYVDATPEEVREVRSYRASNRMVSFEALGNSPQRLLCDGIDDVLDSMTVDRMLAALPPLQERIVRAIDLEGISVVELARRLGYSRRHITRLHRSALERLKNAYREAAPRPLPRSL